MARSDLGKIDLSEKGFLRDFDAEFSVTCKQDNNRTSDASEVADWITEYFEVIVNADGTTERVWGRND